MKVTVLHENQYGDWEGVYFDEKLITEGHSIHLLELLDTLMLHGRPVTGVQSMLLRSLDPYGGRCPEALGEIIVEDILRA